MIYPRPDVLTEPNFGNQPPCALETQIPLQDVLDVERKGRLVWIKCLHLGTIGFEPSLETDAVIFYLAMDSLLDTRCGVGGHDAASRFFGVPKA